MTMPHLMNCAHLDEGWCLSCVQNQHAEVESARTDVKRLLTESRNVLRHWDSCTKSELPSHLNNSLIGLRSYVELFQEGEYSV